MIVVRRLGITDYEDALARMRSHVAGRWEAGETGKTGKTGGVGGVGEGARVRAAAPDEIWLTEHPPVYTLGFAGRREHLRETGAIPIITTERGGQVTYHGPGQVVAYLLLDLRRRKLGVRNLVCRLEAGIIECLAGYGIDALRKPGAPGIYVQPRLNQAGLPGAEKADGLAKIASVGLKVSRGFTWHGVALNGCMDLEPFGRIDPCGFPGLQMTDVCTETGTKAGTEAGVQAGTEVGGAATAGRAFDLDPLGDRLAAALVKSIEG